MEKAEIEYKALTASPNINGETKLVITDKSLIVKTTFDLEEIPFVEINALLLDDYIVTVKADNGDYVFSKLGNWCQPFYDVLCEEYNKAVLRSLFVKGEPIVTAKGDYFYNEADRSAGGSAPVYVYENCVVVLPTNLGARRVPLCFTCEMVKGDFELTLRLDTGEDYTWSKLGYDTAPFSEAVEKQISALREKSFAAIRELDPSMSAAQGSQLVKIIPQGAAAAIGLLGGIAPSFVAALEAKIENTRAAETYSFFKEMCDPAKILIGFRKNEAAVEEAAEEPTAAEPTAVTDEAETEAEAEAPDPYLLWLIAPSPDGQYAAVEFAEKNAATFVYKTDGDFDGFSRQLSRALEAIDFKREVIRLPDAELRIPENADYFMAAKRTAALRFIRAGFIGRVIHSSPEAWKRKLEEYWGEK